MKLLRFLFSLPLLILASPAFILIGLAITLLETDEAPLRVFLAREVRRAGWRSGFRRFMGEIFTPIYRHSITSFVMGGAAFLVVTVGLRGMGVIPLEVVYASLAVEFTMLMTWAITVFYTPPDSPGAEQPAFAAKREEAKRESRIADSLKELSLHLNALENRLKMTEAKFDQLKSLDTTIQALSGQLETVTSDAFVQKFASEFKQFAQLDGSLRQLAERLDVLVSDQLNLRVKREFESMITELSQRTSGNGNGRSKG